MPVTKPDDAWDEFARTFKGLIARLNVGVPEIAARLGVKKDRVRSWQKKTARPPLSWLPRIIDTIYELAGIPEEASAAKVGLLHRMGLIEDREHGPLIDLAYRTSKLQAKVERVQSQVLLESREGRSARVVAAAVATGTWAAAVWPAVEGPVDCRMHVADRIDLRRIDGAPAEPRSAWTYEPIRVALRSAFAVPGTRTPRWSETDGTSDRWAVPYVGAPSAPAVSVAHVGFDSVAVSATTLGSWVHDVGSLLAMTLGYGLTTTRDLAMELAGESPAQLSDAERSTIHQRFLTHPPRRRVWSHHGVTQPTLSRFMLGETLDARLIHVRLVESDRLLAWQAERRGVGAERLREWIVDRDAAVEELDHHSHDSRLTRIDVDTAPSTDERWQQVLNGVLHVLRHLAANKIVIADLALAHSEMAAREPSVFPALAGWLTSRDAPYFEGPAAAGSATR